MNMNSPTPIAVAVVQRGDEFLVGKRPSGATLEGLWEFPGGKVEDHEALGEAAIRECLEETGIAVEVYGQYPEESHQYEHDRVQLHFFACRPIDVNAEPQAPFRWVPRSNLRDLSFPEGNRKLLENLSGRTLTST